MTTPSNPSGIPSLPVVGLLAIILFLGLALAPRAFEFRSWPEFGRPTAVEAVVDRPLPQVPRIEVAGVSAADARRGARGSRDAVAGERPERRSAERAEQRRSRRAESGRRESSRRGGRRGGSKSSTGQLPAPDAPAVVETPAAPSAPAPEGPPQVAEVPPNETVLRPEAPEVPKPAPEFDLTNHGGDSDAKGDHRGRGKGNGCGDGNGRGNGQGNGNGHKRGRGRH